MGVGMKETKNINCFEVFWNIVPLPAFVLNKELRIVNANEAATEVLGYHIDELYDQSILEIFTREESQRKDIQNINGHSLPHTFQSFWKDGQGEVLPVSVKFSNFTEGNILVIVTDMADNQEKDNKIKYLETIIDSVRLIQLAASKEKNKKRMLDGICTNLIRTRPYRAVWIAIYDMNGFATEFAESGLGILPIEEDLRSGNMCSCIKKAIDFKGVILTENPLQDCGSCALASVFGHTACMTVKLQFAGRTYGFINAHLPVAKATDTEKNIMLSIAKDISHLLHGYELEETRAQAEIEKEKAIKMKSDFISLASHQLKTPITTVREAINILLEDLAGPLNEEQRGFLTAIKRNTDRVDKVVSDILTLQKIEQGISVFNFTPYDLNHLLEELPISVAREALLKEIELKIIYSNDIAMVYVDKEKIKKAFEILLKSFVNYTNKGNINIESKIIKDIFSISFRTDNARINVNDQNALFHEPALTYRQSRKSDILMIDMAICHQIIEKHKGKISVHDIDEGKMEIILELPVIKTDER